MCANIFLHLTGVSLRFTPAGEKCVGFLKMTKLLMPKILCLFLIMVFLGCAEHKVDTVEEWCEQINGVDLDGKYRPFWAVIFGVSFDADAIRDEYTEMLNKLHLEKVENRAPKMA